MIKRILVSLGLSAAMIGPAEAIEPQQNRTTSSTVVTSPFSWTGFYAGLNAGGGFGDTNIFTTGQVTANVNNVNGGARPASTSVSRQGFIGGGQIGYNRQFSKAVLGFETDLSGSTLSGQRTVVTTALTGGASLNNNFSSDLKYLGTARGRVGYAFGHTLLYGTGGLAYGNTESSANLFGPSTANVLQFTGKTSGLKVGYVVGGGGEYAFTKKFTAKAEYLYYGLGDDTVNVAVIPGSGGGGTGYNSRFEDKGNLLRLGFNYKF